MKTSDGKPIVELPPKTVKIEYLEFSDDEQEIYSQLVAVSKRRILHLKGIGRVDYTHVFQLVLRLRQVCDHISLLSATSSSVSSSSSSSLNDVSGDEDLKNMISKYIGGANDSKFLDQVTRDLSNQEEKECLICFEPTSSYVLLPCLHYACEDCSNEYFEKKEQRGEPQDCFVCRAPCKPAELQVITKSDSSSVSSTASMINLRPLNFTYSTKLHAIAQNLLKTRKESTRIKTIIFSQWTKMLSVTEVMLNEKGFDFVRLDGTLTAKQR